MPLKKSAKTRMGSALRCAGLTIRDLDLPPTPSGSPAYADGAPIFLAAVDLHAGAAATVLLVLPRRPPLLLVLFAVYVLGLAASRTAWAQAAPLPPDAGAYTRDLLQRARAAQERRATAEALALYEHGARTAPEASSRAMFLYDEAFELYVARRNAEAFAVVDRLVAEPGHPPFGCQAPPPNAGHLYRTMGPGASAELLRRAQIHEAQGRLLEAFEEAQGAATAWTADSPAATALSQRIAQRLAAITVRPTPTYGGVLAAQISIDGVVHGPATGFTCLVVAEPPRMLTVFGRTEDRRETSASVFVRGGGPQQQVELRFADAGGQGGSAPAAKEEDKDKGPPGLLYLAFGLGGGYLRASGPTESSSSGSGHLSGITFFLGEGKYGSMAYLADASIGGGGHGLQALGRLHFELGGRLPLHDDEDAKNGLFLRGGFGGRAIADNAIAAFTLELPTVSAGYTLATRSVVAQVGYRAGPSLVGRFGVGDAYNHQDARRLFEVSLTHGPFASLHAGPVHLDAEIARAQTGRAPGTPVDFLHGTACGTVFLFGLCGHMAYGRSDVTPDASTLPWARADVLYVGGSAVIVLDSTGVGSAGALLR